MSRFVDALLAAAWENSEQPDNSQQRSCPTGLPGHATAPTASPPARGLVTGNPDAPTWHSWGEVHIRARQVAAALRPDLATGDAVAVLAADPALIAPAVQAVWLSGGSVTMLHQPTPRADLQQWAADTMRVLRMIDARLVLLGPPFEQLAEVLTEHGTPYRELASLMEAGARADFERVEAAEHSTALLQLTSGSTAEPKAVRITHDNLWANLCGITEACELDAARDVVVSWLPLFHDMGMVGCLSVPMALGMAAVKVTPADFIARPLLWPELISLHGATVTAAPNFAYAITGRRMERAEDGAFDLSSMRCALNGAEPIDPAAVRSFTTAGRRFGLRSDSVVAAFGMAEATLAVSFAPLRHGLEVDTVDATALEQQHRAEPVRGAEAAQPEQTVREFALLGKPMPGMEVDVVDESGRPLEQRCVGRLRVRGPGVSPGYLTVDGPVPTRDVHGWLDTGDEGYLADGHVVICGRRKDVIIMGGRNLYPVEIERAACAAPRVRAGNAAAVRLDAGSRRERFAVVVESASAGDDPAERTLRKDVVARVMDAVGLRPSAVVVLPAGSLPKTPSGKLKRAATAAFVPG